MNVTGLISLHGRAVQARRAMRTDSTGTGGRKLQYQNLGAEFLGWKQPIRATERTEYAARNIRVSSKLYSNVNPGVVEGDILLIGATAYVVRGVEDQAGLGRVYCFLIDEHLSA